MITYLQCDYCQTDGVARNAGATIRNRRNKLVGICQDHLRTVAHTSDAYGCRSETENSVTGS